LVLSEVTGAVVQTDLLDPYATKAGHRRRRREDTAESEESEGPVLSRANRNKARL